MTTPDPATLEAHEDKPSAHRHRWVVRGWTNIDGEPMAHLECVDCGQTRDIPDEPVTLVGGITI